jgi:hypothetical protein
MAKNQVSRKEVVMRHLRTILGSVTLCLVASTWSLTALAAGPVDEVFQDERSLTDRSTCSFEVAVHLTATIHDRLFLDAAGNLERIHETVRQVVIEFTANGRTLTARGTGGIDIQIAPDGSTSATTFGIDLLLVLPGQGPILLDAGRAAFVFDPHLHAQFEAGPASYDTEAFCAALS